MSQSAKAVLALVALVLFVGAFVSWIVDPAEVRTSSALIWTHRVVWNGLFLLVTGTLVWAQVRKDKVPDFLRPLVKRRLERTGLCLGLVPAVQDGVARLVVFFQNRYERPCTAEIVVRPSVGFWLSRRSMEPLECKVECEGAGFGAVVIPWGIPSKYQGQKQSLDIGATVRYPQRRGKMVRFRDGRHVDTAKNVARWTPTSAAIGALVGPIAGAAQRRHPVSVKVTLPAGVAETVPEDVVMVVVDLWRPGEDEKTTWQTVSALTGIEVVYE